MGNCTTKQRQPLESKTNPANDPNGSNQGKVYSPINLDGLMTKIEDNRLWVLVFRQSYGMSTEHIAIWPKDTIQLNEGNPSSVNYAILHRLEDFRNELDDSFEFKLCWPLDGVKSQHWKQISNPSDSTTSHGIVTGYKAININHHANEWGGLEWTGDYTAYNHPCLIDGSVKTGRYYYYTVGSYRDWRGAIPGPAGKVTRTELWVAINEFDSRGEAILRLLLHQIGIPMVNSSGWLSTSVDQYVYELCSLLFNEDYLRAFKELHL